VPRTTRYLACNPFILRFFTRFAKTLAPATLGHAFSGNYWPSRAPEGRPEPRRPYWQVSRPGTTMPAKRRVRSELHNAPRLLSEQEQQQRAKRIKQQERAEVSMVKKSSKKEDASVVPKRGRSSPAPNRKRRRPGRARRVRSRHAQRASTPRASHPWSRALARVNGLSTPGKT